MARVLAYTSPARGHLYPTVGLLVECARRGHSVEVHALASEVPALSAAGLDAYALAPAIEALPLDDGAARTPLGALRRVLAKFLERAPHEIESLRRVLEQRRPDLLLVDINTLGAAALAEASGLPWAMFSPYLLPLLSRDAPPFGLGLTPGSGPLFRARDAVVRATLRGALGDLTRPTNQLRRSVGAAPLDHVIDFPLPAPRLLSLTTAAFEYPRRDWPSSVHFCGPGLWQPPEPPPALAREDGPPFVLVTASSEAQGDARLIEVALEALEGLPYRVVATSAAHDARRFRAPDNARVERFLPHEAFLPRAAAVICHGGMGITQRALAHGVPVCVVPYGRDQLEVARRVERARAGAALRPSRLHPRTLRAAFARTLACRAGAADVAENFRVHGGPQLAADHLLAELGDGRA